MNNPFTNVCGYPGATHPLPGVTREALDQQALEEGFTVLQEMRDGSVYYELVQNQIQMGAVFARKTEIGFILTDSTEGK